MNRLTETLLEEIQKVFSKRKTELKNRDQSREKLTFLRFFGSSCFRWKKQTARNDKLQNFEQLKCWNVQEMQPVSLEKTSFDFQGLLRLFSPSGYFVSFSFR